MRISALTMESIISHIPCNPQRISERDGGRFNHPDVFAFPETKAAGDTALPDPTALRSMVERIVINRSRYE